MSSLSLTPDWKVLKPHAVQSALWRTPARFAGVLAGRQSGKTELMMRYVIRHLPLESQYTKHPNYFYILPTREQAKRVAWKRLKGLVPKQWAPKISETELTIETGFGSTLYLVGADKPHRIEGMQFAGGVVDESSDEKEDLIDVSILPTLAIQHGWLRRIGVPKRHGVGAVKFKEFCELCKSGIDNYAFFTWPSEDIVDKSIVDHARATLDPKDFNEQWRASWETSSGSIFYTFSDVHNVLDSITYQPNKPLVISSDFNVSPMSWVIGHRVTNDKGLNVKLHIIDELYLKDTSTQLTLDALWKKYGEHKAGFEFYGDATSKARKTAGSAAAQSDYALIKADARFSTHTPAKVFYQNANPAVVNRLAACNALFCNAAGVRRCYIHPRCINLIADLKRRAWKKDTREPDDSGEIGHMSDAIGYVIHRLFPIVAEYTGPAPQVGVM